MTPSTTWPCWSASPVPSTSPDPWRTGTCRGASRRCAGGSRPTSGDKGTREFIKVLRLMEHATLPAAHRSGRVGPHHRGDRSRRHRADPVPPRRATGRALQPRRPPAPQVRGHRPARPHRLSGPDRTQRMSVSQVMFGHRSPASAFPSPLGQHAGAHAPDERSNTMKPLRPSPWCSCTTT